MWSMMQVLSFAIALKKQPWRIPVNGWDVTVFQQDFLYGQLKCRFHICFMSNKICFFAFFQPFEKVKEVLSSWALHKSNLAHRLWLANPLLLSQRKMRSIETGGSQLCLEILLVYSGNFSIYWVKCLFANPNYWGPTTCSGLFWVLGFQKWTRQSSCPR